MPSGSVWPKFLPIICISDKNHSLIFATLSEFQLNNLFAHIAFRLLTTPSVLIFGQHFTRFLWIILTVPQAIGFYICMCLQVSSFLGISKGSFEHILQSSLYKIIRIIKVPFVFQVSNLSFLVRFLDTKFYFRSFQQFTYCLTI